jgi:mannose-1-phosphate guanylyltransferase
MENPPTNIINAGCYIFNREHIDSIPEGRVVSVERETFPGLLSSGAKLFGYVDRSYWLDIGTPAALLKATRDLISGQAQSDAFDALVLTDAFTLSPESMISRSAGVDPTAKITGGTFIDAGAVVGAGASVDSSIVSNGSTIGEAAILRESFLAPAAQVPAGFFGESTFFGF